MLYYIQAVMFNLLSKKVCIGYILCRFIYKIYNIYYYVWLFISFLKPSFFFLTNLTFYNKLSSGNLNQIIHFLTYLVYLLTNYSIYK